MTKHWSTFNYIEFELPYECIQDCSASGDRFDACSFWQRELQLELNRQKMILELSQYGAWDDDELRALDDDELEIKLIWLAACDINEELYDEKN